MDASFVQRARAFKQKIGRHIHEFVFMRAPGVAVVRVLSIGFNLAFLSLVNRYADAAVAGEFFASYALILVVSSVARLGAEQHLIATLPRIPNTDSSLRISSIAFVVTFSIAVLVAVAAFVLRIWGLPFAFGTSWSLFFWLWLATLFLSLNWIAVGALRGLGKHLQSVSLETLVYFAIFVLSIAVGQRFRPIVQGDLVKVLTMSLAVSMLAGVSLLFYSGFRPTCPTLSHLWSTCRESIAYWIASSLSVLNTWMPILLLGLFSSPEEVAVFTLSHRLAAVLLFGLMILNARYAFDYSRLSASNEVGELVSLYRRNTISQLPYLLSAVTLLVVAAPTIFVFSRIDSVDANLLLAVLVAGTLVSAACGPIVTASLATGNAHTVSATMAFTVGVSTLMVFLLKDQMHGLLLAQIVAGTVISQNLIMYFLWMRRQNRLLGKLKNA